MILSELVNCLNYEIFGCADKEVTGLNYARKAKESDIGVAFSKKEILLTEAKTVLTDLVVMNTEKTLIIVHEPLEMALVKVAAVFVNKGYYSDYSAKCNVHMTDEGYACGKNCEIGEHTKIGMFSVVEDDVVIGKHCMIGINTVIKRGTRLGDNVCIGNGSVIGADSFYHYYADGIKTFIGVGKVTIGNDVEIGSHVIVQRGTISETQIGNSTKIGNLIDIGHDVEIGCNCKIVSQTGIAGNAVIGSNVIIYGQTGIANHIIIGDNVTIMGKSSVTKNVDSGKCVSGLYAREHSKELKIRAKIERM